MPILSNPRHERFAQELAQGKTSDEAYQLAGYKANRGNATRMKADESILARVIELQTAGAERAAFTVGMLHEMLIEDRRFARELSNPSAAKGATDSLGKLHGMFVEKTESTVEHRYVARVPEKAADAEAWQEKHAPTTIPTTH